MRKCITMFCTVLAVCFANAQSKIFKEVSDDISSKMKIITQDNNLVGYLVFTQLEKTSEDSFSYKIAIMDENLNDIGTVNFKEQKLDLQAVSFESDVLCLAYLKSNILDATFKNNRSYKRGVEDAKSDIVTQFLGLNGKIIKTNLVNTDAKTTAMHSETFGKSEITGSASLKHDIQLRNIPGKGFACFYGDEDGNNLITYDLAGNRQWKKKVEDADDFGMMTSGTDIYLLSKKKGNMLQGGYKVNGYGFADSATYDAYDMQDKQGNQLRVLYFDNDPLTGKPVLAGNIIDPKKGNDLLKVKSITHSPYCGVFTVALNGPSKKDRAESFSYWNDGSLAPAISARGRYEDNGAYCNYAGAFRDFQGNTYFVGSSVIKKTKWGTIASSVILSPLIIISPIVLAAGGTQKCKVEDAMLLKQNAKGALSFDNTIPCNSSNYFIGRLPVSEMNTKTFYALNNTENKANYVIVDDTKDIVIYNVTQKKVMRTVPHKDGRTLTNIYPAKEGYVMVQEYNRKDKYLKLSIETL